MLEPVNLSIVLEVVARTCIIFFSTYLLMRIRGKRQLMTLNVFDIIIIIGLGSAIGDAMIYSEEVVPLYKSLTAIATALLLVWFIEKITSKLPPKLLSLVKGKREVLVRDGVVYEKVLERVNINKEELKAKLKEKGIDCFEDVKSAILEADGTFIFNKK